MCYFDSESVFVLTQAKDIGIYSPSTKSLTVCVRHAHLKPVLKDCAYSKSFRSVELRGVS